MRDAADATATDPEMIKAWGSAEKAREVVYRNYAPVMGPTGNFAEDALRERLRAARVARERREAGHE